MQPKLVPGTMAQMLPWHLIPQAVLQLVKVLEVPHLGRLMVNGGAMSPMLLACTIDRPPIATCIIDPAHPWGWPAHLLVPIPPDDEARKMFGEKRLRATITLAGRKAEPLTSTDIEI